MDNSVFILIALLWLGFGLSFWIATRKANDPERHGKEHGWP